MGFFDKIKGFFKKVGETISNFFNPTKKQLEQERREKEELKRQLEEERKQREELERQLQKEREEKERAEQERKRIDEQQKQLQEQVLALQQQVQEILKILTQITTQKPEKQEPEDKRLERMKRSIDKRENHDYRYMVYYCSPQDHKIMIDKKGNIAKIIGEEEEESEEEKYEDSDFDPSMYCQPLGFNNKKKAIQFLKQVVKKYGGYGTVENLKTKEMVIKVGEPEW